MQQNRNQIIIMAVLGVVLAGVIAYQMGLFGGAKTPASAPAAAGAKHAGAPYPAAATGAKGASAAQPVAIERTEVDVHALLASLQQAPIDYREVQIQRDPMKPLVGKITPQKEGGGITGPGEEESGQPNMLTPPKPSAKQQKILSAQGRRITAIVWDPRDPIAVVDDEVVSVGYTYPDGVRVEAIEPSHVVFKVDDELITVDMKEK